MNNYPHISMGQAQVASVASVGQKETKDLQVKVAIDTTFLGWLCAVTGDTPKMAMCNLYDLCDAPLTALLKRNGTWSSRKIQYPTDKLNLVLKVTAGRFCDSLKAGKDRGAWFDACKAATGVSPHENLPVVNKWKKSNPQPDAWNDPEDKYNFIKCKFTIVGVDKEIVMTQHEMETLVVESILLGVDDGT